MWILVVFLMLGGLDGKMQATEPTFVGFPSELLCQTFGAKIAADLQKEAPAKTPVVQCVYLPKVVRS